MNVSFRSAGTPGPLLDVVQKDKPAIAISWSALPGSTGQERGEKLDQANVVDPILGNATPAKIPPPDHESMPDA